MKLLAAVAPLAALAASASTPVAHAADGWKIAVIPKGTTHEFWKAIHAGAIKAGRELEAGGTRVEIIWKGPLREDDRDQQIQVVENFVSRRVDGIVLAPLDARALASPVATAAAAGIPVVVIDSGLESDKIVSFVATDNFKGGQLAGKRLAELLGGRGNVVMLRYQVGSASTEQREAGFLEAIRAFPDIRLLSADQRGGATRETAYQVAQNLLNRFGKSADGFFAPNESTTVGLLKALRDFGRAGGAAKMVGFDTGGPSVEALRKGDLQGLVVQNPFRMGYLGVLTLAKHLRGEPVERSVDTGARLLTPADLDDPASREWLEPPIHEFLGGPTPP